MIRHARIFLTDCTDPYQNLAAEEELLLNAPQDTATLFLWQNAHTVVIGVGQNAFAECRVELLRREGGRLARRCTGGGAVYHDLGNLNFSFILPKADYDVQRQLRVLIRAVSEFGIQAEATGRNDVTAEGRKFSGNAFRVLQNAALHHGTLLLDTDSERIGRYLNVSAEKLKAKGVKSVPSRVISLKTLEPEIDVESMRLAMIRAFMAEYGEASVEEVPQAARELTERYASKEWILGRSPEGSPSYKKRFPWGGVEMQAKLMGNILTNVAIFTDAMDETLSERLQNALEGCPWDPERLYNAAFPIQKEVASWLATLIE